MLELVPEVAGDGEIAEGRAVRGEPRHVEAEVALLVGKDRDEATPERERGLGVREERPREQLDRLELVVRERVEDAGALRRIAHAGERRDLRVAAGDDREVRGTARRG